jgi:hypothetical protein
MSTKEAAHRLQESGLPITLCAGKDGKAPLGHGYTKMELGEGWQTKNWTPEEIEQAFNLRGNLNVGIRFGPGSCIDIEADNEAEEESFRKLFDGYEIPRTPAFKSKRGVHRLFRWSEVLAVPGRAVLKFNGLGIRIGANGKGAHSCVPPSVNTDGTAREWIVSLDDCDPAPLPDVVLRRILEANKPTPLAPIRHSTSTAAPGNRAERARKYLAKMPEAVEGEHGDDHTFHAACVLVHGFDLTPDQAWPIISEWNLTCRPPWDDKRLRRKLDEADKDPGERGHLLVNDRPHERNEGGKASKRNATIGLPSVQLPGGAVTITSAAEKLGALLGATGKFFTRGGSAVRMIDDNGEPHLEPIRAPAFCSDLETVARLMRVVQKTNGEQIIPATCSESVGRLILESVALRSVLPPIQVLSRCPVLIERDGELVSISGYDRASRILASGKAAHDIDLGEALELLDGLVKDFRFSTSGDKARALIALITPAMVFGGLLNGRSPIDLGEADESQAGKGYRNKVTAAIYKNTPRTVAQRTTGGVGSVQEMFDSALVAGACFVPFDNFRGRLDLPGLESFLTEDTYLARVPYSSPMAIDPRRVVVMFTSNRAEVTPDLANRGSCVRILKQPSDYKFAKHPEGDLLDHVVANQPRYLGAVFGVVREWHRRGKPELETAGHDFRRWARVMGYISEYILGAGGLLVGHREAQQRIASPGLTWLRDVTLAVLKAGQGGLWLRPHHLLTIVTDTGIDTSGIEPSTLEDEAAWLKATQALGRKLGKLFRTSDTITIDASTIERREVTDDQYRPRTEFAFFPQTANNPE